MSPVRHQSRGHTPPTRRVGERRPRRGTGLALGLILAATTLQADQIRVPSGQPITFIDEVIEAQPGGETWLIRRYLAPDIARDTGTIGYEAAAADLDALCDSDGLAAVAETTAEIDQIVITLMDRPVERGETDAEATQFIGAYLPSAEGCIWQ